MASPRSGDGYGNVVVVVVVVVDDRSCDDKVYVLNMSRHENQTT